MVRIAVALKQIDWIQFITTLLLILVGVVVIYSTPSGSSGSRIIYVQLVAMVIGVAALIALTFFDYRLLKKSAYLLYGILLVILVAVLVFGQTIRGTRGWFVIGPLQFQPSELAKVILLIVLARYFSGQSGKPSRFQYVVVSGIITALPVVLILLQPDFGQALVLIALWLGLMLLFGIKRLYSLLIASGGLIVAGLGWIFLLKPYQKDRILTFLDPNRDPLGAGYNMIQSKIAIGSGGWFGKGLGLGTQSQLNFLPAQHTDFIFAVLAEELGFLGAGLLILLLAILLTRLIYGASRSRDTFGLMLIAGATILLLFQIVLNIGMNLGIIPVAGITLPFVSYGGSSLLMSCALLGICQSVYLRRKGITFE